MATSTDQAPGGQQHRQQQLSEQIDLFPAIDLGDRRHAVGVDGCSKPIGRRAGGRRRRHQGRARSTIAGQLLELRRLVEAQHEAVIDELAALRRQRRSEHESIPAVLRRITEIERHLRLVETPTMPRITRRRPLDG
jgi:hypothetical protein